MTGRTTAVPLKKFMGLMCDSFHFRWITLDRCDVQGIDRMKHPQQVMVWGIICSDGKKMDPIFFRPKEKCNTSVYYNLLRCKVLLWLKYNFPDASYVWQQDGAPAHTAKKNQTFIKANFAKSWPKDLWPPSSPDLNPLDYFWWSVIEKEVNVTPHPNLESLKSKIKEVWATYPAAMIEKACAKFQPRLEAVVAAEGSWIEH